MNVLFSLLHPPIPWSIHRLTNTSICNLLLSTSFFSCNMSIQDRLHEHLDQFFHSLQKEWDSPLIFDLHLGPLCATEKVTYPTDICAFLSGDVIPGAPDGEFAFFDRTKFPPPNGVSPQDKFLSLRTALESSAIQAGFELVSEGSPMGKSELAKRKYPLGGSPPTSAIRFRCSCFRRYRKRTKKPHEGELPFRKASLHNDRSLNNRGHLGKKGPRRTSTNLSTSDELTCPFQFSVFLCDSGFSIRKDPRSSRKKHQNHFKRLPADIPPKLKTLSEAMKKKFGELNNSFTGPAAARNFMFANHGFSLTRSQSRFALKKFTANGTVTFDGFSGEPGNVVDWLREQQDTSFCVWGAQPTGVVESNLNHQSSLVFAGMDQFNQFVEAGGNPTTEDLTDLCHEAIADHQAEAEDLKLTADQHLFVACAWTTNKERRLFRLSPDVLKFDATEGTNTEGRPLLTVSMRTAFGNYLVIARMLLRDQKEVSFRWAFSFALPRLLGRDGLQFVKAVMTDGDSQEINAMQEAIQRNMPHVFRMRCAWHIIFKGWARNCGLEAAVVRDHRHRFRLIATVIKKWCFTFCWPCYCETSEELKISKCLLLAFLHSRPVRKVLTSEQRQVVLSFLRDKVFIHDRSMAMAHKLAIRCHNEVTNSSHEGTNNGLKEHSAPVRQGQPVKEAAKVMKFQSDIKAVEEERLAAMRVASLPLWSLKWPTSGHVTELCHDLVVEQWQLGKKCVVSRSTNDTCNMTWKVAFSGLDLEKTKRRLHPVFQRVTRVSRNADGRLICSCCHFERCGQPCRHQAAVIMFECPTHPGFSHHDVCIMWWKKFIFFGERTGQGTIDGANYVVSESLRDLMRNDVKGPLLPSLAEQPPQPKQDWNLALLEEKDPQDSCINGHEGYGRICLGP